MQLAPTQKSEFSIFGSQEIGSNSVSFKMVWEGLLSELSGFNLDLLGSRLLSTFCQYETCLSSWLIASIFRSYCMFVYFNDLFLWNYQKWLLTPKFEKRTFSLNVSEKLAKKIYLKLKTFENYKTFIQNSWLFSECILGIWKCRVEIGFITGWTSIWFV